MPLSFASLPPGFQHSFLLVAAEGITGTVAAWREALSAYYSATAAKLPDLTLTTLGYQTDNGAQLCRGCEGPLDACLLGEKAYLDSIAVPVQYLSFQVRMGGGGEGAGVCSRIAAPLQPCCSRIAVAAGRPASLRRRPRRTSGGCSAPSLRLGASSPGRRTRPRCPWAWRPSSARWACPSSSTPRTSATTRRVRGAGVRVRARLPVLRALTDLLPHRSCQLFPRPIRRYPLAGLLRLRASV